MTSGIHKYLTFIVFIIISTNALSQNWKDSYDKAGEYINQKNLSAALTYIETAIEQAKADIGEGSKNFGHILGRACFIYKSLGNNEKAIQCLLKEKNIFQKVLGKEDQAYATVLHNLGTIYQDMGRYREAEPFLKEALEIKKKTRGENDTSYAKSLQNLAVYYQNFGQLEEAEKYYYKSLKIKKANLKPDNPSIAQSYASLGALYKTLGNNSEAEKNYKLAIDIFKAAYGESHSETINAESELAMIYIINNNFDAAEPLLKKVEKFQSKSVGESHPDYAITQYNLGKIQLGMKNLDKAEKLIEHAKTIEQKYRGKGRPIYSYCLNALGVINWQKGNLTKAYNYFSEATQIKEQLFGPNHPELAVLIHNLAGILKDLGQYKQAEQNYDRAFELYNKQLREYFPFLSDNEKARFYAKMKEKFDMFNCYVMQRGMVNKSLIGKMYDNQLAIKAILLNSSKKVRRIISESKDDKLKQDFISWINIKNDLSRFYSLRVRELKRIGANIDSLEKLANTLEKNISRQSSFFEKEYDKKIVHWQDVRKLLKKDEAAIEIIRFSFFRNGQWTDTIFYAALIVTSETKDYPEMVVLERGYDLEKFYIKNYEKSIRFKISDQDSYKAFWEEIDAKLKGKKNIYLSKDGIYNKLNVNTLMKPGGRFVIDDKNIFLVSNTKDLVINKMKKKDKSRPKKALLFGNPDFNKPAKDEDIPELENKLHIADLYGTIDEINGIDSLLLSKNWKTNIYLKEKANEENFKGIRQADIIHVATHGFFRKDINDFMILNSQYSNVENPLLRSGLLFSGSANYIGKEKDYSPASGENGILTAYEAMNLVLDDTKLVVLSACETGLGEIRNGEGVYGLQRAFQVAGAQSIIMSIWKVNDAATQLLMVEFYKKWLGGMELSKAFKEAQLFIKARFPHPYYWGGFILIGSQK